MAFRNETSWEEISKKKNQLFSHKRVLNNFSLYFSSDYITSGGVFDNTDPKIQTLNKAKIEYFFDLMDEYVPPSYLDVDFWYNNPNENYKPVSKKQNKEQIVLKKTFKSMKINPTVSFSSIISNKSPIRSPDNENLTFKHLIPSESPVSWADDLPDLELEEQKDIEKGEKGKECDCQSESSCDCEYMPESEDVDDDIVDYVLMAKNIIKENAEKKEKEDKKNAEKKKKLQKKLDILKKQRDEILRLIQTL